MKSEELAATPVTVTYCHCKGGGGVLVVTAVQLATRRLSWAGSMSWSDGPKPLAAVGQGGVDPYVTSSITRSCAGVAPGLTSFSVSPLLTKFPLTPPQSGCCC